MNAILAIVFAMLGCIGAYGAAGYARWLCMMRQRSVRRATVMRIGEEITVDVAGVGEKRLERFGDREHPQVVGLEVGDSFEVYWSEELEREFYAKREKGVVRTKDKGALLSRLLILSFASVCLLAMSIWILIADFG